MNNLILEILPDIQETAKKISRIADQQNELTQFAVMQCYRYEELVTRLHSEGNLKRWLYRIIKNEYVVLCKNSPVSVRFEAENEDYLEPLQDFIPYLSDVERAWIRLYIEAEGNYREMERLKDIHHTTCSSRMKLIIEKCRILKSTLF